MHKWRPFEIDMQENNEEMQQTKLDSLLELI